MTHDSPDRSAVESLRGYLGFLEEMHAKYGSDQQLESDREQRARRAVEAAFSEDVESP